MGNASRLHAKKDGTLRFCVYYIELNAVTVPDSYLLPPMDECIYSIEDARVFSSLDATSGYWQIEVNDSEKEKRAFTTYHELYKRTDMPFGLKYAPATFQHVMDIVLSSVKWQIALVYLD